MEENFKDSTKGLRISSEKNSEFKKNIKNISDLKTEIEKATVQDVSELIETMMVGAINLGASDVHVEPEQERAKIRTRVDGILQDVSVIEYEAYESLLSRTKLISGIKFNISDRPQDGRFSILLEDLSIEIRTSTLPAEHGESIVMRILNPKSLVDLETLGLRKDLLELFKKEISKPNGMIIVTGPTGSGKTTTLYAFLKKINKPEIKIITIEDPIEYHISGISQTQVNPSKGYDFASGLQSIVRQDPDVILVGEIRDPKTCQIALQAALTGHLVFSTLHTNDAAGTVARLTSLEGALANIGPAVNMAIAQRLVRKVCKKCNKLISASPKVLDKLKNELKSLPKTVKIPSLNKDLKIPRAKGCKECNFTGFKGRLGIFEAILIDDEMERFILDNPSIAAFREQAIRKGMIPMRQDGLIKVLEGQTTIEEVERVSNE
ncbi:MAG: type II/IV secretion system protein [Candidatus Nealsonbacteria bacterium]|nr:type II/IV secretion system protein [Candidatus Nealsonbacteria bacterium]